MVRKKETTLLDFKEVDPSRGSKVKMTCIKDTGRAGAGSTGMGVDELET